MSQNLSRQYATPLLLNVAYSKIYRNLLLAIFVLSALSVYLISTPFNTTSSFIFICVLLGLIYVTYSALLNNQEYELNWQENNYWLITQNNMCETAELCESSVITSFCAVLNFNIKQGKRQTILLFNDNVDAQSFRRLRVRVKVQGIKPQSHDTIRL